MSDGISPPFTAVAHRLCYRYSCSNMTAANGESRPGIYSTGDIIAGRYQIRRRVAKGSRAVVYLADDLLSARDVALKMSMVDKPKTALDIEHEAEHLAAVSGRCFRRVYDVGRLPEGQAYAALEWVEGQSLNEVVKQTGIATVDTLHVTAVLADALATIHAHGIVHRDIKPQNVLVPIADVPRFTDVKMADFGLARSTTDHSTASSACVGFGRQAGTPAYMAPEQLTGRGQTTLTDVYGLGATLFFMLYHRPPLDVSDLIEVDASLPDGEHLAGILTGQFLLRSLSEDVRIPEDPPYPAPVREMVALMLRRDPRQRIQSAHEILNRLELCNASVGGVNVHVGTNLNDHRLPK